MRRSIHHLRVYPAQLRRKLGGRPVAPARHLLTEAGMATARGVIPAGARQSAAGTDSLDTPVKRETIAQGPGRPGREGDD